MGEESWFEDRYPNLLNNRKAWFLKVITEWTYANWGKLSFDESDWGAPLRQNIYTRGAIRNDNEFEKDGDRPQSAFEADKVLGSFAIDITTPVDIKYSTVVRSGRTIEKFRYSTVMYVEDVLGLQEHDTQLYDTFTGWLFPSRKVRRASWKIGAEGMSYTVKAGDTLSLIAQSIYGYTAKWKLIQEENRILDPNKILVGERLRITER